MVKIQILGTGCAKCSQLAENAKAGAEAAGIEYEMEKVTVVNDIVAFGVMMTPALAVDGAVKVSGAVPSADEIAELLK